MRTSITFFACALLVACGGGEGSMDSGPRDSGHSDMVVGDSPFPLDMGPPTDMGPTPDDMSPPVDMILGDLPFPLDMGPPDDMSPPVDMSVPVDMPAVVDLGTDDMAACTRPSTDPGSIGTSCAGVGGGGMCPTGYTCEPFEGFVLQHFCEIPCAMDDCDCPSGTMCVNMPDKAGSHYYCGVAP